MYLYNFAMSKIKECIRRKLKRIYVMEQEKKLNDKKKKKYTANRLFLILAVCRVTLLYCQHAKSGNAGCYIQ